MPGEVEFEVFTRELEELGEDEVRRRLGVHIWGDGPGHWKWVQAREYLDRLQRERDAAVRQAALRQGEDLVEQAREANRLAKQANEHADKAVSWAGWSAFGAAISGAIALAALAKSFGVFD